MSALTDEERLALGFAVELLSAKADELTAQLPNAARVIRTEAAVLRSLQGRLS